MRPVVATAEQIAYWTERDGVGQQVVEIGGPAESPDVIPCQALLAREATPVVIHVAFRLDDAERAELAAGGTLWLSSWGGLPVHLLEVITAGGEKVGGQCYEAIRRADGQPLGDEEQFAWVDWPGDWEAAEGYAEPGVELEHCRLTVDVLGRHRIGGGA